MEGVAVSARGSDKTFTTTVYTNDKGQYSFPSLDAGEFRVWAQAIGFEAARAELKLIGGKKASRDFTLKTLPNFSSQLQGDELMASLPDDGLQDSRGKAVFTNHCTGCHQGNYPLQNRFDARGWSAIIDFMSKTDPFAAIGDQNRVIFPMIQAYKEDLVRYLTRVRGPDSPALNYKLVPRPRGEATQIVVTEYDLSPGERPNYMLTHNGSIWSEGVPSAHEARSAHDAIVDRDGYIWFTDQINPERTIGKLDPKTGRVWGYKLPGKEGRSVGTHGLEIDPEGNVWFTNGEEGTLTKFDPKTEQFVRYPQPESHSPVGSTVVEIDSKGNVWTVTAAGAAMLDRKTGKYSDYRSVTPGGGPYGLAIDSQDNAWFSQIGSDRVGIVDSATGKVSEVVFDPVDDAEVGGTDRDREIAARIPPNAVSAPPYQKGPRRMGAEGRGDSVWVALYYADRLARVNIHTKKITEYRVPHRYTQPYDAVVDKNNMVWIALMNTDRFAKFNPLTERFTEYPLPTRGTEARFIEVDNRTNPPTIWLPYYRSNKIARVEFRVATGSGSQAAAR